MMRPKDIPESKRDLSEKLSHAGKSVEVNVVSLLHKAHFSHI